MEVKINPNLVSLVSQRVVKKLSTLAENEHLQALAELSINDGSARTLVNHIQAVLPEINSLDVALFCELSSLCYFARPPVGEFRFAKNDQYRNLRSEQKGYDLQLNFLQALNAIARASKQHAPYVLVRYEDNARANPSERWAVTFLYDLAAHLRLAGIKVLVCRPDNRQQFVQLAKSSKQFDIEGLFELSAYCDLDEGYLNMMSQLIEHCCGPSVQLEYLKTISLSEPIKKTSQFLKDTCELSALVEPRVYKLEVEKSSIAHTHLLVKHDGPLVQSLVSNEENSDIKIGSVNVHVIN